MKSFLYAIIMLFIGITMDAQVAKKKLAVTSSSFKLGQSIPAKYSYTQGNISPHISWSKGPEGTKSYVLICDDPDAPRAEPWVHWVVFNIPVDVTEIQEGSVVGQQGMNDYQQVGWGGPNPPSGTHRYFFKVYALSNELKSMPNKVTKKDLLAAMKGKILAEGGLMGTYSASK